jgi:hypothetical protein
VRGAGGEADHRALVEDRHHQEEVVQVPRGDPWVVRQVDVARRHGLRREAGAQGLHRLGHSVDMPRRAGDGLRQHAPVAVEDARRDVPAFAHDGAEGRAHQRLALFLHHRQEAGPHDLQPGLGDRHGVCSIRILPPASMNAVKSALRRVVVCGSTIRAGPRIVSPGVRSARSWMAASTGRPVRSQVIARCPVGVGVRRASIGRSGGPPPWGRRRRGPSSGSRWSCRGRGG